MSHEEIIQSLKHLKAEIEWDHSLEYQQTIDEAISIVRQMQKKCICCENLVEEIRKCIEEQKGNK